MAGAKRARTAETPKQPSLSLRLRAPYFYPTPPLIEAAARGVPIVATAVRGIPELIRDGHNGLLVPSADPAALAGAIARVLDTPGLAAQLAAAGWETVRSRFAAEAMARRYGRLYARLTAGPDHAAGH